LLADHCKRICSLPLKRAPVRPIPYLEDDEMQAVLAAPDQTLASGRRDYALLLFLYNTGARVQELANVRAADLQLSRPPHAMLHGKGNKERICPLWATTVRALRRLLDESSISPQSDEKIFRNARGEPITRFGIDYILKTHVLIAANQLPSLKRRRVSPHVIRHTAAVHMLNSGVDLNVIRAWLGHVDLRTTNVYAEINLATKRAALETCAPAGSRRMKPPSWRRDGDLLAWLEQL
jgi:site-specific recombinase XerD